MNYLPCLEVEPASPVTATVIWLHGLGADGYDFEPIIKQLNLPVALAIRFVFPHAPSIPVTINNGNVMPAWYDILDMRFERKVDEEQLLISATAVQSLIDREVERGVNSERIVIAGFSQGGAVAFQAALSYTAPLAGLLALSTYFATVNTVDVYPENEQLPIEIYHGRNDPVVNEEHGKKSVQFLKAIGFKPNYSTYPMEHSVCPDQIRDISNWLQKTLL